MTRAGALFQAAAEQNLPEPKYELAMMHLNGIGFERNVDHGISLLQESAELLYAPAQYMLSLAYFAGTGVEKSSVNAFQYALLAAEQGHAEAQHRVGNHYNEGDGTGQDFDQAVIWFQRAAIQRVPAAQYNLAYMYSQGLGVERNYGEAFRWASEARLNGFDAATLLAYVEPRLEQERAAQRRADRLLRCGVNVNCDDIGASLAAMFDVYSALESSSDPRARATASMCLRAIEGVDNMDPIHARDPLQRRHIIETYLGQCNHAMAWLP